jgi:hypothetical protein
MRLPPEQKQTAYATVALLWARGKTVAQISDEMGWTRPASKYPYGYTYGVLNSLRRGVCLGLVTIRINEKRKARSGQASNRLPSLLTEADSSQDINPTSCRLYAQRFPDRHLRREIERMVGSRFSFKGYHATRWRQRPSSTPSRLTLITKPAGGECLDIHTS